MTLNTTNGYIFIPLYNIEVQEDLTHSKICGFSLITSKEYFDKYLQNFHNNTEVPQTLAKDISFPKETFEDNSPVSFYLLVKKIRMQSILALSRKELRVLGKEKTHKKALAILDLEATIKKEIKKISSFIIAARVFKTGFLHIFRYYICSNTYEIIGTFGLTDSLIKIQRVFSYNSSIWDNYKTNESDIRKIYRLSKKIQKHWETMERPITFFSAYYGTDNIYDKLLRLITVLEMLLTNDSEQELNYRLSIRASCLLKRDVFQIIKLAYDCRSKFVHSGTTSKNSLKELKKFYPKNPESDTDDRTNEELIFQLIQTDLETIVREVLNAILKLVDKTGKKIGEIDKDLDREILSKLSK